MARKRGILTAPHAIAKAEKATREQLEEVNERMVAEWNKVNDAFKKLIKDFRVAHAPIHAEQKKIQDALLDRLSDEAQARVKGYEWFRAFRPDPNMNVIMFDKDAWGGWQPMHIRKDPRGDFTPLRSAHNARPSVAPDKNGSEFEYLEGEDDQGNCIPECLEIDSDDVSPRALGELALTTLRIVKRHRESLEDMAGIEETTRRLLKRARVEGNLVAPPVDPDEAWNEEVGDYGERVHARDLAAKEKRKGKWPYYTGPLPGARSAAPASTSAAPASVPAAPAPAPAAPAPTPAAPASAPAAPASAPAPTGSKIRIGKDKMRAAAAAGPALASSSPPHSPSPSTPSVTLSPPASRDPSPTPEIPDSPQILRRAPRRGCRKSIPAEVPDSEGEDSDHY
jgi:hypothetical protein